MSHSSVVALPLLHIDDDPAERRLVANANRSIERPFQLYSANGAQSAAPHFRACSENEVNSYPQPAVVLLDYDLGTGTGADFLYWLRQQTKLISIPVIMYSGSVNACDITECYSKGANHFLHKSKSFKGACQVLWLLSRCMTSSPPNFALLSQLPEYVWDPRMQHASAA